MCWAGKVALAIVLLLGSLAIAGALYQQIETWRDARRSPEPGRLVNAGGLRLQINCTGTSSTCPADGFQSSTTVCRSSAGDCDVAESCTGTAAGCPSDGFRSSTVVCRPSAGPCDMAESCTGTGPNCPSDGFELLPCPSCLKSSRHGRLSR